MSDYFLAASQPYRTTIDEYCYLYDTREDSITGRKEHWLKIIFVNGKFDKLYIPREDVFKWIGEKEVKFMGLIKAEIEKLEQNYKLCT